MLEEMLIRDEGLRLKPYQCTADKLTIGVGRNLDANGISEDEARLMLKNDIRIAQQQLEHDSDVGTIFMAQNQARKDALVNMCFNMGLRGLKGFRKMWKALDSHDYDEAAAQAADSRWYVQVGSRGERICAILETGNLNSYK